jgi:hypothetical protein
MKEVAAAEEEVLVEVLAIVRVDRVVEKAISSMMIMIGIAGRKKKREMVCLMSAYHFNWQALVFHLFNTDE